MKKALFITSLLTLIIGGCSPTSTNIAFDKDGFPKHQYYVGGGYSMDYSTDGTNGTLIFADSISRTTILTQTMDGGKDSFDFSIEPENEKDIEPLKAIGIDPNNMKLSLYFIPHKEATEDTSKLKGLKSP